VVWDGHHHWGTYTLSDFENVTDTNAISLKLEVTQLRMNPTYVVYYRNVARLSMGVIPMILLVFFNGKVIRHIIMTLI
jgi:hypothetical protein